MFKFIFNYLHQVENKLCITLGSISGILLNIQSDLFFNVGKTALIAAISGGFGLIGKEVAAVLVRRWRNRKAKRAVLSSNQEEKDI